MRYVFLLLTFSSFTAFFAVLLQSVWIEGLSDVFRFPVLFSSFFRDILVFLFLSLKRDHLHVLKNFLSKIRSGNFVSALIPY